MSCPNNDTTELKSQQGNSCKENCVFNFNYNPNSTCELINKGDYLEIKTDGKNKVTYNSIKITLKNVRLYVPSLHTFDGEHTDAELILKHDGGTKNYMICLPIKSSSGSGDSVNFFSQISSHIPFEVDSPANVNVKNWSLNKIMPAPKTPFYNYNGGSPYPPCNMHCKMIVFDNDHAGIINSADLDLIKKTIKPVASDKIIETMTGQEGFTGDVVKKGMITYNSSGVNNTAAKPQAMECTEYDSTDIKTKTKSVKKPAADFSKLFKSPAFIIIIVILFILAGGIFFYKILWPIVQKNLDGTKSAKNIKIPGDVMPASVPAAGAAGAGAGAGAAGAGAGS